MSKESFILYTEYADHLELLTMEQRGILITAIFAYEMGKELPEMDIGVQMAFSFIRANLDRNRDKYEAVKEKRIAAGIASAKARKNREQMLTSVEQTGTKSTSVKSVEQTGTNATVNVNVNDNVNVNGNVNSSRAKSTRFSPPTLQEIQDYIEEKGYDVDAERFFDFYESKGWMVGKNKMKDWKAAVRTWSRDKKPDQKRPEPKKGYTGANYTQRQVDYNKILGLY